MPILILIDLWNFHIIFFQYTPNKFQVLTGFPIVGRAWGVGGGGVPPILRFFQKKTPSKLMSLHGAPPAPLKNEATPHPLKCEAPFHEMIP